MGMFLTHHCDSFYWETPLVSNDIFESYLKDFSSQNPGELKIVIIDNAGFHASQNITIPDNIKLIRIPTIRTRVKPRWKSMAMDEGQGSNEKPPQSEEEALNNFYGVD